MMAGLSADEQLQRFISQALAEDVGDGDHTTLATIRSGTRGKAVLLIKEDGVLAGVAAALAVFRLVDEQLQVDLHKEDGAEVAVGDYVLSVSGSAHSILLSERLVLNIMQRMSGIATQTRQVVDQLAGAELLRPTGHAWKKNHAGQSLPALSSKHFRRQK